MDTDNKNARNSHNPARRMLMCSMAGGFLAGAMSPAVSRQNTALPATRAVGEGPTLDDYLKRPLQHQQQQWRGATRGVAGRASPGLTQGPMRTAADYQGSGRLVGRRALITGGDTGLGRAAAIAYAREGADVAINYLPAEEAEAQAVIRQIRDEHQGQRSQRKAVAIPGDIRDEAFCNRLVSQAAQALGGLDILVNNASRHCCPESIMDISTAQFDDAFKTNVYAMFWITKAAIPHLKPGSTVINSASAADYDAGDSIIDYAATKAAITIFTKGLARQLMRQGVRVNAIAPGTTRGGLQVTGWPMPGDLSALDEQVVATYGGEAAEVAALYAVLGERDIGRPTTLV